MKGSRRRRTVLRTLVVEEACELRERHVKGASDTKPMPKGAETSPLLVLNDPATTHPGSLGQLLDGQPGCHAQLPHACGQPSHLRIDGQGRESHRSSSAAGRKLHSASSCSSDIKPGTTVTVQRPFILRDDSVVTVEVKELLSFDGAILATKEFTVG